MGASDASLSGFDRRECHRAHFYADVEIEWGEQTLRHRTSDISLGGIMIETDRPLLAGTQFRARVTEERTLELKAGDAAELTLVALR